MKPTENIIPTNDIVFQLLFGKNKNKCLTNDFIKSTLTFVNENTDLSNIHINSEFSLEKITLKDRRVRLDILTEYDEELVCIEMQNRNYENIYERAFFYASKINAVALNKSEDFTKLKPLTMIIILNYIPKKLEKNSKILQKVITIDAFNNNKYINIGLKFIFIFLPKLKEFKTKNLNNDFYMWLKFLEYKDMEVIDEVAEKNENIKRAQREMFMISAEEEEKTLERFHENYLMDRKFDRYEAREEGIKKGKKESLIEFTKKMLAKNYNIQEIIDLTGLSEKEINMLAKSI